MAINEIKVSVVMPSYNHERYIRKALDSVIMQRTNFRYEILVGDDASQDGTAEILKEYSLAYPDILRIFLRERNLGASRNVYELMTQARGEYIASLDGDDFWTDETKLQRQVDFLESNPGFIGCAHAFKIVDDDGNPVKTKRFSWVSDKKVFSLSDFKGVILPGHPSTMMKRNIFKEPKYDYSIIYKAHPMICDRTGAMIALSMGDFYIMERPMGAYRVKLKSKEGSLTSKLYADCEQALYNDFLFTCRLQEYAENTLHIDGGFETRKKELFASALCKFLLTKDRIAIKTAQLILRSAADPVKYVLSLPTIIAQKIWIKLRCG